MTSDVDPRFQKHRKGASRRRRRAGVSRWMLYLGVPVVTLGLIAELVWLTWDKWSFGPIVISEEELEEDIAQIDPGIAERTSGFTAAFIDLPGDPMLIRLKSTDLSRTTRKLTPPIELPATRKVGGLILVSDVMVSTEESFITTLPSSPEDFALFQQLRAKPKTALPVVPVADPGLSGTAPDQAEDNAEFDDDEGGWGTTLDQEHEALPEFAETRIENTTSVALVRPQAERKPLSEDFFARIASDRDLGGLLQSRGVEAEISGKVQETVQIAFGVAELKTGMVVALRTTPDPKTGSGRLLKQIALYDSQTYFGTLSRDDEGQFVEGADPWVGQELFDYAEDTEIEVQQEASYRILDAFYSTAIRNRVPSVIVGEAIALLSKAHDLDAFAAPGDRMDLLYAADRSEDDSGSGQILYIALKGESVDIECYVYQPDPDQDYVCYGATPQAGAGGGVGSGMVTPTKGVLTSRFGPRNHPILKTVRLHAGVDWAAPTGTPIAAAFAGTVASAGNGGGYGNLVRISHPGGFETRYAHMSKFATQTGATVAAGQVIGYVGTTGRSTGPHLHFELRVAGQPVDPLTFSGAVGGSAVAGAGPGLTGAASGAVEQLVNKIIKVESGGNARARNPLSTATGLGQFIESTWIRMMNTYRPDLVASLGRAELLELRFDPTISREMVRNLAREGESYLKARGHAITAGRLYLCHFLGADGAHKVLRSGDEADLLAVLGTGVINANPFLRGKNVAYIKEWAERKMSGKGYSAPAAAPVVIVEPKGLPEYRETIRSLLGTG